jgi:hypothetical protein
MDDRIASWPDGLDPTYELVAGRPDRGTVDRGCGTDLTVILAPARIFIASSPNLTLRFEGSAVNPGMENARRATRNLGADHHSRARIWDSRIPPGRP